MSSLSSEPSNVQDLIGSISDGHVDGAQCCDPMELNAADGNSDHVQLPSRDTTPRPVASEQELHASPPDPQPTAVPHAAAAHAPKWAYSSGGDELGDPKSHKRQRQQQKGAPSSKVILTWDLRDSHNQQDHKGSFETASAPAAAAGDCSGLQGTSKRAPLYVTKGDTPSNIPTAQSLMMTTRPAAAPPGDTSRHEWYPQAGSAGSGAGYMNPPPPAEAYHLSAASPSSYHHDNYSRHPRHPQHQHQQQWDQQQQQQQQWGQQQHQEYQQQWQAHCHHQYHESDYQYHSYHHQQQQQYTGQGSPPAAPWWPDAAHQSYPYYPGQQLASAGEGGAAPRAHVPRCGEESWHGYADPGSWGPPQPPAVAPPAAAAAKGSGAVGGPWPPGFGLPGSRVGTSAARAPLVIP